MLRNHLKIAFRNLLRDHVYTIINLGGLAVGISASILLTLWVQDELSFDRFHKKADRIYRVNANFANSGNPMTWTSTPAPLVPFSKEIPAVQEAGRISGGNDAFVMTFEGKTSVEDGNSAYVDSNFFTVFDFPFTAGDPARPFPDNHSIVISRRIAQKYFGESNPVGKVLRMENKDEYKVSAVIRDIPENSSIRYEIFRPFDILIKNYNGNEYWKSMESDWGNYMYFTYVLIDPTAVPAEVASKLSTIHQSHQQGAEVSYSLQPLTAIHLYNPNMTEAGIQTVRIFLIVAVIILLIACINYINLATARATKRAREVGVRKAVGATRSKLIAQFMVESAVISVVSLVFAMLIIEMITPFYNELSGKHLSFNLLSSQNLTFLAGALLVTALIAGLYPAMVLSSFQPLQTLRNKLTIGGSNTAFRKILVITQFTLSIVILAGTMVIDRQLAFIRNKKLGFDKENIFMFGMRGEMFKNVQTIRTELGKQSSIEMVTLANQSVLSVDNTTGDTGWDGKDPKQSFMVHPVSIDENFIDALRFEIVQGHGFTGAKSDTAGYILNETAVREAGLADPIGKSFTLWNKKGTVIGVVKDFHHASMKNKIDPSVFFYNPNWLWLVYVRTNGLDNASAIAAAERIWKQYNPAYPFEYKFLDDEFDAMYKSEQRMSNLFKAFSMIAILVSCMGLLGLSTFTAAQRVKEIGIRKVMGASVRQIVLLLSADFLKLVVVALVIAIPVSYFGTQSWLQGFVYRMDPDWSLFAIAGATALCIAFFTISFQTIRAAIGNPVDSLRNE